MQTTKDTKKEITKHTNLLWLVVFVSFVVTFVSFVVAFQPRPQRIISLVPALTEMLYAIGAGPQVIAVSSYDEYPPEVKALPRVGALLDPDTERIIALKADLVITYGSQVDLQAQMTRAGIATFDYRHAGLAHILATITELGARTGHATEAGHVVRAIEARLAAVRARVAGKRRPKTLLVFSREPKTLRNMYVSGGRGFLHDMLEIAGGDDLFSDIDRESVQVSTETVLARAPEVIIELRPEDIPDGQPMRDELASWARLASVPAVRNQRVHFIAGQAVTVPGPRVADSVERMAKALHP
ncbi:MAG: cobalamin-binding protein [Acidobacteriota bacterium]|nr:cobalamin-binding protein [Acidobacteriota bacterium]